MISYDDFKKVELTVGKIIFAEKVPDSDKLLRLQVDFGEHPAIVSVNEVASSPGSISPSLEKNESEREVRQIISGIALHYPDPQALVGRKCLFVTNIPPRMIRGLESNGMILAVSTEDGQFSLFEPQGAIPEGTRAK